MACPRSPFRRQFPNPTNDGNSWLPRVVLELCDSKERKGGAAQRIILHQVDALETYGFGSASIGKEREREWIDLQCDNATRDGHTGVNRTFPLQLQERESKMSCAPSAGVSFLQKFGALFDTLLQAAHIAKPCVSREWRKSSLAGGSISLIVTLRFATGRQFRAMKDDRTGPRATRASFRRTIKSKSSTSQFSLDVFAKEIHSRRACSLNMPYTHPCIALLRNLRCTLFSSFLLSFFLPSFLRGF